ncbi:MAG: hypothetical protein ACREX4_20195, partial [Gammaproteobacteria bacterium]
MPHVTLIVFLVLLVSLLVCCVSDANAIPAFPGAEGGGAQSTGGRGGDVIMVTSLANSGAGTLRNCTEATGPRTCIFRVAGTIELSSALGMNNQLTVAGQSAPGGGIQLSGKNMTQAVVLANNKNNIVFRYIRIRKGFNNGCANECGTCLQLPFVNNSIFDHVTVQWNQDEGVAAANVNNITFSYFLVAEPVGSTEEDHPTGWGLLGN